MRDLEMLEGTIRIDEYDPRWPGRFQAEAELLRNAMGNTARRIEHVGSTSVPGLAAKPVIDIQISVENLHPLEVHTRRLAPLGYAHVPLDPGDSVYPFYQKPPAWPSTHHVHLCVEGSIEERNHILFRDYLRSHPEIVNEYAELKRRLAGLYPGRSLASRESYSLAKSEFVTAILSRALAEKNPVGRCS